VSPTTTQEEPTSLRAPAAPSHRRHENAAEERAGCLETDQRGLAATPHRRFTDMTNTQQTTISTAQNRTSGKEASGNETQATGLTLRAGRLEDAETCGYICYKAFKAIAHQHNFPPDFPSPEVAAGLLTSLLSRDDIYSVVAEADERVVGSNFLWENGAIAGVGPITIDPAAQNVAVGRRLMEDVLRRAEERNVAGVRLVQVAYHNRSLSLYTKLGFDAREPLSNLQGPAIEQQIPGYAVRPATEDDLDACNKVSLKVHGHHRGSELLEAIGQGSASVVEHGGRITGYTTTVGFFGHTVGESNEDLKALIGAAPDFPGPGFLLPTRNAEVLRWCLERGLSIVQPMTLMSVGLYNEPAGAFMPSVLF
jgi:Acetyltransferase (GNAT) family